MDIIIIAQDAQNNIEPVGEAYGQLESSEIIKEHYSKLSPHRDFSPKSYSLWKRNGIGRYVLLKTINPSSI